jgi:hypothetical protein
VYSNAGVLPYAFIQGKGVVSAETGQVQAEPTTVAQREAVYDAPPPPHTHGSSSRGVVESGGTDINMRFSAPKRSTNREVDAVAAAPRLSSAALSSVFGDSLDDGFDADAQDTTVPTLLAAGL